VSQDAFRAGIVPGGLTSIGQIKTLVCFLISKFDKAIPHDILITALTFPGIANYFDCVQALEELNNANLISLSDEGYLITEEGAYVTSILYKDIPLSIRERAVEATRQNMLLYNNIKQHNTFIEKYEDGFLVHCNLSEPESRIFTLSLYAPNKTMADRISRNFINNAESIIDTIITKMTSAEEE